jgi:hypothetical protein
MPNKITLKLKKYIKNQKTGLKLMQFFKNKSINSKTMFKNIYIWLIKISV